MPYITAPIIGAISGDADARDQQRPLPQPLVSVGRWWNNGRAKQQFQGVSDCALLTNVVFARGPIMSAQVVIDYIENEDKKSCTFAEFNLVGKLSARGFWHSKTRPGGAPKGPKRGWKHGMRLISNGEGTVLQ